MNKRRERTLQDLCDATSTPSNTEVCVTYSILRVMLNTSVSLGFFFCFISLFSGFIFAQQMLIFGLT